MHGRWWCRWLSAGYATTCPRCRRTSAHAYIYGECSRCTHPRRTRRERSTT